MSGSEAEHLSSQPAPAPTPAQQLAEELLSVDEYSQYMLKSKSEMFAVFRGLIEQISQITMFFNEGRDLVLTSLSGYSDNGLFLDLGGSPEMNDRALKATKLFCATRLDKVKIQFILRGLQRVETKGGPAFFAPLPEGVLRLQRREYYRLPAPLAPRLKCLMSFHSAAGEAHSFEAQISDISGGGIGVISIPPEIPLESGMQLDCRIELPEVGVVTAKVVVRCVFESIARKGTKSLRAGCEFVKLPGLMLTLIQRYIIKVERDRKAHEAGLL